MKQNILIAFLIILCGCSSEGGSKFIGTFRHGNWFVKISKAGDNGFFINKTDEPRYHSDENWYCTYEEGCFIDKEDQLHIFCENGNHLIDSEGNIFYRQKAK